MSIGIPVWGIIIGIIVYLTPIVWAVITMFFAQKETKAILAAIMLQVDNQEKLIKFLDSKFEDKHNTLENQLNNKIEKVRDTIELRLSEMNINVIKVQTLVELLVMDKIKKP